MTIPAGRHGYRAVTAIILLVGGVGVAICDVPDGRELKPQPPFKSLTRSRCRCRRHAGQERAAITAERGGSLRSRLI